mmetsp:Transcript_13391/g.15372  ORF Transcript_13391/g.15372 Transcript_13391/m.15372 type:complete len:632 (-) Transcript_13391:136-2031(-)
MEPSKLCGRKKDIISFQHLLIFFAVVLSLNNIWQVSGSSSSSQNGEFTMTLHDSCSPCGEGKQIINENAILPSIGISCLMFQNAGIVGLVECDDFLTEINEICGCRSKSSSRSCSICGEDKIIQDAMVDDLFSSGIKCPLIEVFAKIGFFDCENIISNPDIIETCCEKILVDNQRPSSDQPDYLLLTGSTTSAYSGHMKEQSFRVICGQTSYVFTFGNWYKYRAETSGSVHAMICGSSAKSKIDIYQPTTLNNTFHCLQSKVFHDNFGDCNYISWEAKEGEEYAVLVSQSSPISDDNMVGSNSGLEEELFSIELLDNQQCNFAFGPVSPTSNGVVLSSSIINTALEPNSVFPGCEDANNMISGLWYKIVGTGMPINISIYSNATKFDRKITIFHGDNCDNLINIACVTCLSDDNIFEHASCENPSTMTFSSISDELYYAFIYTSAKYSTGIFRVTISSENSFPNNANCNSAQNISLLDSQFGQIPLDIPSNLLPTEPNILNCNTENALSIDPMDEENIHGLWYKLVGVENFSSKTTISFSISILNEKDDELNGGENLYMFTGDCRRLICIQRTGHNILCEGSSSLSSCVLYVDFDIDASTPLWKNSYYIFISATDGTRIDPADGLKWEILD